MCGQWYALLLEVFRDKSAISCTYMPKIIAAVLTLLAILDDMYLSCTMQYSY